MSGGSDTFNGKEVVEGKITTVSARAVGHDGVVKDIEFFNCGGEIGVNNGIEVGVEGLKYRNWPFVRGSRFIDKSAASDLERFWEETSGKDKRDEALELVEPDWVETCE